MSTRSFGLQGLSQTCVFSAHPRFGSSDLQGQMLLKQPNIPLPRHDTPGQLGGLGKDGKPENLRVNPDAYCVSEGTGLQSLQPSPGGGGRLVSSNNKNPLTHQKKLSVLCTRAEEMTSMSHPLQPIPGF